MLEAILKVNVCNACTRTLRLITDIFPGKYLSHVSYLKKNSYFKLM